MSERTPFSSKRLFAVLLAAGFCLQLGIAACTEGYPYDQSCFLSWALRMADVGPAGFYSDGYFCDYPPGYLYVLWGIGKLMQLLHIGHETAMARMLLALPSALGSCGLSALAFLIARRANRPGLALPMAGFVLLCPALLFDTAVWKQIDAFFLLPLALAFYFLSEDHFVPAAALYGLALAIKPQALLAGPVLAAAFAAAFVRARAGRRLRTVLTTAACAALSAAVVVLAGLPFWGSRVLAGLWEKYTSTGSSYAYAVINAFNLAEGLGGNWVPQTSRLGPLSWQQWGILLLCLLTAALALLTLAGLKKHTFCPLLLGAFYTVGVFTLSHRMHERYLMPGLAFTLLAAAKWGDRRLLGAAAGLSLTGLVNLIQVYSYAGTDDEFMTGALPTLAARLGGFAETAFFILLAWTAASLTLGAQPHPVQHRESAPPPLPLPQPRWTMPEAVRLGLLSLGVLAVSLWDLGSTKAPQNPLEVLNGSQSITVQTQTPAAEVWVYPGISYNGVVEIFDADSGMLLTSQNLDYSVSFSWLSLPLPENSGHYCIAVSAGRVMELSLRDANGSALAVSDTDSALFDEQSLVPGHISCRNSMYFDEIYHARTAYEMAHRLPVYETTHPPLGKDLIMLGVMLFGMTAFGWRVVGAVFGAAMVPLFYLLARRLTRSPRYALLGAVLLSLDGLRFVQTRIATIDVYATFFILLSAYCMVWYAQQVLSKGVHHALLPMLLCGAAFGLGCASKWTGIYAGAGLAIVYFAVLWLRRRQGVPGFAHEAILAIAGGVLFFVVLPLGIYLASYLPYYWRDPAFSLQDWWNCQLSMYWYHSTLQASHPFESRWYTWPFMLRPVWYYAGHGLAEDMKASIAAIGNPVVWLGGTAGIGALVWRVLSGKGERRSACVLVFWLVQVLPWLLVSRCTFLYHYFPGMIFSLLALVLALESARREGHPHPWLCRALAAGAGVSFVVFYPLLSGMAVPAAWLQWLQWLPTWGW